MSEHDEIQIVLSPEEEEELASKPATERAAVVERLLDRPGRPAIEAALVRKRGRGMLENPRIIVVAGLALVIAAGLLLAGTLIPEAINDPAARVACAIGLVGLVIALSGLASIYVASGSATEPAPSPQHEGAEEPAMSGRRMSVSGVVYEDLPSTGAEEEQSEAERSEQEQ